MRIRKISQTVPVSSEVIGINETPNEKDVYSSASVNMMFEQIMGVVLWTNPNPTSDFGGQEVTLINHECDMFEIFFKHYKTDNTCFSVRFIKGFSSELFKIDRNLLAQNRGVVYVSDTQLKFESGYKCPNGGSQTEDNGRCIPLYIVGYKTGLFDE